MAQGTVVHAGHMVLFGAAAYFLAVLVNSFLKNWLNVNLQSLAGTGA